MRNLLERVYSYVRRFFLQRNTLFSSPEMGRRPDYEPGRGQYEGEAFYSPDYRRSENINPQDYERQRYQQRGMYSQPGYGQWGYGQPGYPQQGGMYPGQGYPQSGYPQRGGINPLVAGGIGALGGGLAGYGIGQAVGGMQEHIEHDQLANGDYNIGEAPYANGGFEGDGGGLSEVGFGEGDFGGGDDW